jgi:hypothetical protein
MIRTFSGARAALTLISLLAAGTASAAGTPATLSLDLGTTGVGAHVGMPLGQQLGVRVGAGFLSHKFDGSTSTIDYNIDAKLRSADALLDWYPAAGSGFRLSAGIVYDANQFDVTGKPSAGRYLINGVSYAATDVGTLTGAVDYNKFAPYLGIGFGTAPAAMGSSGWGFAADLGGYYQGKGGSHLDSVGCKAVAPICQAIARDVAVERLNLADQVSDVPKIYPVLRISATYRF